MTAIVGVKHKGRVWLGCDSQMTYNDNSDKISAVKGAKLFQTKHLLIAGCGSPRALQILKNDLCPPVYDEGDDYEAYMYSLSNLFRDILRSQDFVRASKGIVTSEASFLVAWSDRLFGVSGDGSFAYIETLSEYAAEGSGRSIALGSLYTTQGLDNPKKRIITALEAAAAHQSYVGPPFQILATEKKRP